MVFRFLLSLFLVGVASSLFAVPGFGDIGLGTSFGGASWDGGSYPAAFHRKISSFLTCLEAPWN
jgi:hypothetical protein